MNQENKLKDIIKVMKEAAAATALSQNDKEILLKYASYLKLNRPMSSKQASLYDSVLEELRVKKEIMCEVAADASAATSNGFDNDFERNYNELLDCLNQPVRLPVNTDNQLLKDFFSFYPRMDLIGLNDNTRRYKLRDFIQSASLMQ